MQAMTGLQSLRALSSQVPFRAEPGQIMFTAFEVGQSYQQLTRLHNCTLLGQRLRSVIFPPIKHGTMSSGQTTFFCLVQRAITVSAATQLHTAWSEGLVSRLVVHSHSTLLSGHNSHCLHRAEMVTAAAQLLAA